MAQLCLHIDVPMCSFRPYTSKDYQDTYPAPPPSTLFGMLLSLLGVEPQQAERFFGNRIGIAIKEEAEVSQIVRKMRRDPASGNITSPQYRPEYQEILTDLKVYCLIDDNEARQESLVSALNEALDKPESLDRYGGLCLGESTFLVDAIHRKKNPPECLLLQPDERGTLVMPVWTNFQLRSRTRLQRFELVRGSLDQADIMIEG